jgi:hypothetical protein
MWAENVRRDIISRNKPKILLKTNKLAFSGAQDKLLFEGKNPPSKPKIWRKIHQLWGISLSVQPRMSRHILDCCATSA